MIGKCNIVCFSNEGPVSKEKSTEKCKIQNCMFKDSIVIF